MSHSGVPVKSRRYELAIARILTEHLQLESYYHTYQFPPRKIKPVIKCKPSSLFHILSPFKPWSFSGELSVLSVPAVVSYS